MRGDINIIVSKYASLKPKPSAHTRRTIKFVCCIKAITCAHRFGSFVHYLGLSVEWGLVGCTFMCSSLLLMHSHEQFPHALCILMESTSLYPFWQ